MRARAARPDKAPIRAAPAKARGDDGAAADPARRRAGTLNTYTALQAQVAALQD